MTGLPRAWLHRLARDAGPHAEELLAAGDVEGPAVGAAEGAVGYQVFGRLEERLQLALGRDHVNARAGVEGLTRPTPAVQAGGDVEVPLGVDRQAVAAAARGEVVERALAGYGAVGPKVVGPDAAGAASPARAGGAPCP